MTRTRKVVFGVLLMSVVVVTAIALFDWNLLRGPIERQVYKATGRQLTIKGDLQVKFGWPPTLIVNDVSFANAPWSREPLMAKLGHAEVTLDLFSLLRHTIVLPSLRFQQAQVWIEKNAMGVGNWQFDPTTPAKPATTSRDVNIRHVYLSEVTGHYLSPTEHANIVIDASSAQPDATGQQLLKVEVHGIYLNLPTRLQGELGMIMSLKDLQETYPLSLHGQVGATQVSANGSIANPSRLQGINMQFTLSGDSLADLFPLVGVPLPPTPHYAIKGKLLQSGQLWNLPDFSGSVGSSDLQGRFSLNLAQRPQFINADLQSNNLDLNDLSGFIGNRSESGQTIVDAQRVLPSSPLSFEKLHAADANVHLRAKHIQTKRLPIDDMNVALQLSGGVLQLTPLSFGVASGSLDATISVDANQQPNAVSADVKVRRLMLKKLFPGFDFEKANAGVIGGRIKLTGHGDSIAEMLASADGQVAFLMNGGSISKLVVRLANLDVANTVVVLLGGDKSVPIRCMVTDATVKNGNMTLNTMVLDTQKSLITGKGTINFADESLNLRLTADAKDISLVALRGPIDVTGTFKHPHAAASVKNVAGRVSIAAALGAVLTPLAFIPLLDFGGGKDSDCGALLADAERHSGAKTPIPKADSMRYDSNDLEPAPVAF